ncbi:MAG: glycosyltransferase [Planctomycetes bacterium]|nr:glycosyltransferase [Planctomycetota bacterium]
MRIGIVSYFAPPQPAVAAHRVLRLTRALLAAGHEVHWVTVDGAKLVARDDTLTALIPDAVVQHGLGGPTLWSLPASRTFFEKVKRTLAYKLSNWLPIPDRHVEWVLRLRRRLPALAVRERFDVVLMTCGPHGQILALPRLRRAAPGLMILVDYRDLLSGNAWTGSDDARVRDRLLERERRLLRHADALFVNSEQALAVFAAAMGELPCPVEVMRNAADFGLAEEVAARWPLPPIGDGIHLGFFGSIFPRRRMLPVLEAMARLPDAVLQRTTLHAYCGADTSRRLLDEDLARVRAEVRPRVVVHDYLAFAEALRAMAAMTALVLVNGPEPEDNIFIPGKLYDYLMAQRPVLFIGNHGDAWRFVADTSGPDRCFLHADTTALAAAIAALEARPEDLAVASEHDAATAFGPLLTRLDAAATRA